MSDDEKPPTGREAQYWRENLKIVLGLLLVWFLVSYGAGILLVDVLDRVRVYGFKLGFWFAQQGSILCFVALIYVYVKLMQRLDRRFDVHEGKRDKP